MTVPRSGRQPVRLGLVSPPATSLAHRTGDWRTERPVFVELTPPCSRDCPAGEDVRGWLSRAQEPGGARAAWELLTARNPLPATMGRVCYRPCEAACLRGRLDEAVGICAVEQALGEQAIERGWPLPAPARATGCSVLVVGAGPAGLAAAHLLRQAGHEVHLHESLPVAGGMLRYGISAERLPRRILDAEIDRLLDTGIELRLRTTVRRVADVVERYDAVVHCVGVANALALVHSAVLWRQPAHGGGPAQRTVTYALGQGRAAAQAVCDHLGGAGPPGPVAPVVDYGRLTTWYYSDAPRAVAEALAGTRTSRPLQVVPLDGALAGFEARRCMSCGSCFGCDNCFGMCPDDAITKLTSGPTYEVDLDYCKGCGICAAECPCGAIEMVPEQR